VDVITVDGQIPHPLRLAALVLMTEPHDSKVEEILTTDEYRLPRISENQPGAALCDVVVLMV
jgi:hypothetical protein